MHFGVAVTGMCGTEPDRPGGLADDPQLPPGLAAHRYKGRDLSPFGKADPREDRLGRPAGIDWRCCLLHVCSPLVDIGDEQIIYVRAGI